MVGRRKEDHKEFSQKHLVFRERGEQPCTLAEMRRWLDEVFIQSNVMNLEVGETFVTDFRIIKRTK